MYTGENKNRKVATKDVCSDCGNQCCKLGGVVATRNEVDAITERGYPNHFVKLSKDIYSIDWGKDGSCVYLNESGCSIYPVRPSGCRMFPVVQTRNHEVILVGCSLAAYLSDDEILTRKRILLQRPKYIILESERIREDHIKELRIWLTKYDHQKI